MSEPTDLPVVVQGDILEILPLPNSQKSSNNSESNAEIPNEEFPQRPLFMGYYPDWAADTFPPEKIDYARYDWIDFAFAVPTEDLRLEWDSEEAPVILSRLVAAAHLARSKVKLSIGGWTGSKFFSTAVSTPAHRQVFATNILSIYSQFDLDGIDIDWEYPGHEGEKGNVYDRSDTQNLLAFLTLLRSTLPPSARITAAVQTFPFEDGNGQPLSDASGFAAILDWILVMNYDTWGSSTSPGPNAPLYDSCGNSTQPEASALASYKAWTNSGFPASKLVLGLPAYGYVQKSAAQRLRNRFYEYRGRHRYNGYRHFSGHFGHDHAPGSVADGSSNGYDNSDSNDDSEEWWSRPHNNDGGDIDHSRSPHDNQGDESGEAPSSSESIELTDDENQIQFRDLVEQGALRLATILPNDTFVRYQGHGGFERRWDSCSETPFLRSASAGQIVTYDDPESLALKARFAKEAGMLGVNMFDIHGDTDSYHLADSIRSALGLS